MADKNDLIRELDAAKVEMNRCMGGVDQAGCVAASRRVAELRLALRDDAAMLAHLQTVLITPLSTPARARHRAS